MKLTFRSKLIARTTPGLSVRTDRPMAESANVLIIPPCTKPAWLVMSSVGVISTTAVPSPVSMVSRPSHAHVLDVAVTSLTNMPLWDRHPRRRRVRHQSPLLVQHVSLAEVQRLLHLDHAADRAQAPLDHRAQEVDLQLDSRVPHPIFLQRPKRYAHRRVGDLGNNPALHDPASVPVLRPYGQLEDHPARLRFDNPNTEQRHPPVRFRHEQPLGALEVLQLPLRPVLRGRVFVRCFGAAAIASATSLSSSLPVTSPERRLRSRMIRSRTRAASSNCSSFERRRISFSRSRTMASKSSRGTPAPAMISIASAFMSFALIFIS